MYLSSILTKLIFLNFQANSKWHKYSLNMQNLRLSFTLIFFKIIHSCEKSNNIIMINLSSASLFQILSLFSNRQPFLFDHFFWYFPPYYLLIYHQGKDLRFNILHSFLTLNFPAQLSFQYNFGGKSILIFCFTITVKILLITKPSGSLPVFLIKFFLFFFVDNNFPLSPFALVFSVFIISFKLYLMFTNINFQL